MSSTEIEKCRWYRGADSPVILMIDDLANAWFDANGNGTVDVGEDYGFWGTNRHSAYNFLEKNLLSMFSSVKITFFLVTGRVQHLADFTCAKALTQDSFLGDLLRKIRKAGQHEIAYHGLFHGVNTDSGYKYEYEYFPSLKEAIKAQNQGLPLCEEAYGEKPQGGKYPGYRYNRYADQAIDQGGFLWWCRDWDRDGIPGGPTGRISFKLSEFGDNKVVDIPSTVHGGRDGIRHIRSLLRKRQIISIQEHIAPFRPDGRIQTPNIVDDIENLLRIFSFLEGKNVWMATGSEVAEYYTGYCHTVIGKVSSEGFQVWYDGRIEEPVLSICITVPNSPFKGRRRLKAILTPTGQSHSPIKQKGDNKYICNIRVVDGYYKIEWRK